MNGLTGLRLALYDELLRNGAMRESTLATFLDGQHNPPERPERLAAAVSWLAERRLFVAHEGEWRAVGLGLAKMNYESNGPATAPSTKTETPPTPTAPIARGATAAVQRHQREFFCNDGYRESLGTL